MQYEDLIYEIRNGVAWIIINRPDKMNAFRGTTCDELIKALYRAGYDKNVGAIVLAGAGDRLDIQYADARFGSFICSIIKTTLEMGMTGHLDPFDAILFDLGSTLQGTPLAWSLLVRNTGTATLTLLTDPPTVTGDFLAGNFGTTSVAAGASTTFDVLCDATTLGSPVSGTISFGNNDGDENPFNFTVTCTASL